MHRLDLVDDGNGDPEPCVLVLARSADMEMNELSIALAERGVRMARIDIDRCLDLSLTVYPEAPLVELDRWVLRPLLVWRRHFELAALPVDPGTLYGAYVADQWRSVADWITNRGDWAQVNSLATGRRPDRLTQLSDAAAFGLRVPRTVVTTRPARHRPGGGTCIVKTSGRHLIEPSSGVQHGLFPRPLDPRRGGGSPEPAPVIVQQYLPSDHELRVFVVGERLIAYRVDKLDPAQLWVDPDAVDVHPVDIPTVLSDTLRALARFWRLDVAAFDLLMQDGQPVFLEVNINCDWRWFERRSADPAVSTAVASWVAERFEQLRPA
ncbi:MAG TPA: hypothetical protein VH352_01160 [Pseudonocardiaceae bacterium]|nr:hypothetical protein [Pseudonocardiaceae bacterium]